YLFDDAGQLERTFLSPQPGGAGEQFGFAVAAKEGIVAVTDPAEPAGDLVAAGGALPLGPPRRPLLPTPPAPPRPPRHTPGPSVAAGAGGLGRMVFVGVPGDDTAGQNAGAIQVFDSVTGAFVDDILSPAESGPKSGFGTNLTLLGDDLVVSGEAALGTGGMPN